MGGGGSGIWKVNIGEADKEIAYTSLAARGPCIAELNALPGMPFPFSESPIEFLLYDDRMIHVRIPVDKDESIYGFGLQFDGIRKNKQVLELNVDHWARGGGRTHAPVPFYISEKGYGVLFNTARFLKVHVKLGNCKDSPNNPVAVDRNPPPQELAPRNWDAQPASDAVEANLSAKGLELIVFAGRNIQDVVARYNLFCGGGAMPPLWGLGFWHRLPADYTAEESETEVAEFDRHQIPLDVVGLEPGWMSRSYPCTFEWQKYRFPDPAGFVGRLLDKGVRINLWENPYISPEGKLYDKLYPYAEIVELEQNDQFMLGPSILVAPYYEEQLLKRTVKLRAGNWYDFYTGEFAGNGITIEVSTPERIPLFVREGAVISLLSKHIDNSRDVYGHPLEVRHYGKKDGSFELYEDDGKTFNYEKGEYSVRSLHFEGGKGFESVTRPGPDLFGPVENWVEMTL